MMDPGAAEKPFGLAYIRTKAGGVGLKVIFTVEHTDAAVLRVLLIAYIRAQPVGILNICSIWRPARMLLPAFCC